MASPYEVEVKLLSAKNLKNVNWRNGPNLPYAVVWVDPAQKRSTNVDKSGDTQPNWNEKLITHMPPLTPINNCIVFIDVLHLESDNKPPLIIGSAQLPLNDIKIDDLSGVNRTLKLKRPSGRPQGTVDVKVIIKNLAYHAPYGVPPHAQHPYGSPYGAPPAPGAGLAVTYGNPYNVAPPPPAGYGYPVAAPTYVAGSRPPVGYPVAAPTSAPYAYGQSIQQGTQQGESEKSSQFGLGTGLAVGAGAGLAVGVVVGGIGALALGKDKEAEKVEKNSYYDHEVYHHPDVESDVYYDHVEEANVNYEEYSSYVEEVHVDHEEASHVEEANANVYYEEYTSHVEEASNVEETNQYYEEYVPEFEDESYVEEANAYYEEY